MRPKNKSYYLIREVSDMLGIPVYTIRFWETHFDQLCPAKNNGGQRRYTDHDIEVIKQIQHLVYGKGLKIKAAKEAMPRYFKYPPRHALVCRSVDKALTLLSEAKNRIEDVHAIVRIEAVEKYLREID